MFVEFVCLANSVRPGGRCVAGVVATRSGWGWVRPVGPAGRSELWAREYVTSSGRETKPFDVVDVELAEPCPTPAQPENRFLSEARWQYVRTLDSIEREELLRELESDSELLFGSNLGFTEADALLTGADARSLTVITPREVSWEVRHRWNGTKQLRMLFRFGDSTYDLSVTDPEWFLHFADRDLGPVDPGDLEVGSVSRIVVSLGEEWNGRHYKIVATVVEET